MPHIVSHPRTSPSLLVRLRDSRDGKAWELFIETYGPLITRFCRRRGLQDADAVDVSQEVMTKVVQALRTFEYQPARGRFRDWLGAVVRSRLADFHALQKKLASVNGQSPSVVNLDEALSGSVDAEWPSQFHDHLLRVAMERTRGDFEPQNWRAFELTWLENRPPADVARTLSLPVATVYVAKFRILERLRKEVLMLAEDMPHLLTAG
ncbi:MAG: RNA polymerase sigma factor [Planctomycetales bacterium]